MNKRIKELAEQAGFKPFDVREDDTKFKKFAELIVRECARVAAQTLCPYEDECSRTTFGHTWDMACVESAREIKQHFGIKDLEPQSAADRILSTIRKRN